MRKKSGDNAPSQKEGGVSVSKVNCQLPGLADEPLNEREEVFCREYICDVAQNATEAYMRAFKGNNRNSARTQASELLAKVNIKARIQELREERNKRFELTADRVQEELMKLAFYNARDFFDEDGRVKPLGELTPDQAAAIAGIETLQKVTGEEGDGIAIITKIKLPDKKSALELLGKTAGLKMFTDKTELTGENGGPVQVKIEL